MVSQGAQANFNGKDFEADVNDWIESQGFSRNRYLYEACWNNPDTNRKNSTDGWIEKLGLIFECKFQNIQGTADQKAFSELWNAKRKIDCQDYILVYGGSWWDKGRGLNIYNEAKIMAEELSTSDKTLHVMTFNEFKAWIMKKIGDN